ncbi:MAG: hypothetical protein WC911_11000 [Thermoleophilia bacterium]
MSAEKAHALGIIIQMLVVGLVYVAGPLQGIANATDKNQPAVEAADEDDFEESAEEYGVTKQLTPLTSSAIHK